MEHLVEGMRRKRNNWSIVQVCGALIAAGGLVMSSLSASADTAMMTGEQFDQARKFVDTEFGRIAYVERGEGPVALFIHGALLNGYQWRHQLTGLSDIRRVICPDSLGMGYTEMKPSGELGMAHEAEMFRAFLDALGIDKVDVVGNDSGGGAAQIFAANNPDRVRTLTLTNCEVDDYDPNPPAAQQLRSMIESGALLKTLQNALVNPAMGKMAFGSAYEKSIELPDDAITTYVRPLISSEERVQQMYGYFAATSPKDTVAVREKLLALDTPVMVLWGLADSFFKVEDAHWLRDNLNVVEYEELEGAPVFWPEERPEYLNAKLREFWTNN